MSAMSKQNVQAVVVETAVIVAAVLVAEKAIDFYRARKAKKKLA